MEEEEKGFKISEIFKLIFKRIWWVVGVTAAVMIVFVCLIQFLYNPSEQYYSASYDIRLPSGSSYPDGTVLNVEDSVLLENLQIIKDESLLPESQRTGKFVDINIEKMINEDDITLIRTIEAKEDETYEYHYTVKITKKYFKNKEQATAFVRAVVEFPVYNAKNIVNNMNYSERLARFDAYNTYEEKISALIDQKNYIVKLYEDIKQQYSGEYVPVGLDKNKDIDAYIRDMTDVLDVRQQDALRDTVSANYYVWDTQTFLETAQAKIDALSVAIKDNEARIKAQRDERDLLKALGTIQETTEFDRIIADLTDRNAVMSNEKSKTEKTRDEINAYTSGEGKDKKDAFDARMLEARNQLEQATQTLKTVNVATYNEKAQVLYVNNKIVVEGGLNIILAAVIGAVIGFVIVSALIFIIDYPKYKREKLAAEAGEDEEKLPDGEEKE